MFTKKYFIPFLVFGFSLPFLASAAVLTVSPPSPSNEVIVTLNTQGQSVNAIEVHLAFDPAEFSISLVSDGGSIVNLWIEQPTFSNVSGTVDFSGIIPGGTATGGKLATITIVPKKTGGSGGFRVLSATVLLNDGKGTQAPLSTVSAGFTLTPSASSSLPADTQPPDFFTPEIGHDPNIFNGQYFLAFSATDQFSGIDHYDVLEVSRGTTVTDQSPWQVAHSPYLLKDQTLSSDIYVRAVDQAGNSRTVEIPAPRAIPALLTQWWIIFLCVVFLIIFMILSRSKGKKRS